MDYLILIIGGGPAGLSTALHLIKFKKDLKNKIIVIEARKYPTPKPCGGAITPEGIKILRELGLSLNIGASFNGFIAKLQDQKQYLIGKGKGRIVERGTFDKWLAEQAMERGIKVVDHCRVHTIKRESSTWFLETLCGPISGRYLVGADGVNGITRQIIPSRGTIIPLRKRFTESVAKPELPIFDFSLNLGRRRGYSWNFPTENGIDEGIFLAKGKPSSKEISTLVTGYPEHLYTPWNLFWKEGIILVGERIGVDPLLGEGIAPALEMGQLAARALIYAIENNIDSFPHYYNSFYSSFTGKKFRFNTVIANIIYGKDPDKWISYMVKSRTFKKIISQLESYGELYKHPVKLLGALITKTNS